MHVSGALQLLLANRNRFRAFVAARLGSEADADDVLQASLVKAMQRAGELRDGEKLTAWFYQILRRTLVDHARGRRAAAVRDDAWAAYIDITADGETRKAVCGCFEALLVELKPREAKLLRRVELNDEPVGAVARSLGLTANHASVALHRARTTLREKLERFCGECASSACRDCDCREKP